MLRRIHSLTVRDIRGFKNQHTFSFGEGVTLVKGRNGSGKTTLATMLAYTLLIRSNASGLKRDFTPNSGGAPMSSVTFTADAGTFTISKVWGDRDATQLLEGKTNKVIAKGEQAEDMVCEITFGMDNPRKNYTKGVFGTLEDRIEGNLAALFFHAQGTLKDVLQMGEALRNIGLQVDDQELAKAFGSVSQGAKIEADKLVSSLRADGRPRADANGKLVDKQNALASKKKDLEEAENVEKLLIQNREAVMEIQANMATDDEREDMKSEVKQLRFKAETHQKLREAAAEKERLFQEDHAPISQTLNERRLLENSVAQAGQNATEKLGELNTSQALKDQAMESKGTLNDRYQTTKTDLANVEKWLEYTSHEAFLLEIQSKMEEVDAKQNQRSTVLTEMTHHQNELKDLRTPSSDDWARVRDLQAKIKYMEGQNNLNVKFLKRLPENIHLQADGEKLENDGHAADTIDIQHDGKTVVRITPILESGESLGDIKGQYHDVLASLDASDVAELNRRQKRHDELQKMVENGKATLEALPSFEELETERAKLENKAEQIPEKPEEARPNGDLNQLKLTMKARMDELKEQVDDAEEKSKISGEKFATAQGAFNEASQSKVKAETTLHDHVKAFGPTVELTEKEQTAKQNLDQAKAEHEAYRRAKDVQEDAPKTRASNLENHLLGADDQRKQLAQLEERIDLMRADPRLIDLPHLEAEINELEREVIDLERDFKALQFLHQAAAEAQNAAQVQSRSQITEELDRLLEFVWGRHPRTNLNEDGTPDTLDGVDFIDESFGTREQYNIVLRAVLLSLLRNGEEAEAGHSTIAPMILDDALVYADSGRLKRMKDVLQSKATEGLQLIIFSCDGNDYADIATETIDLDVPRD